MSTTKTSTDLIFHLLPSLQQELNDLTADRDELLADYDLLSRTQHDLTDAESRHHRSKVINAAGKMLREKNGEILRLKQRVDDCKRIVRLSLAASSRTWFVQSNSMYCPIRLRVHFTNIWYRLRGILGFLMPWYSFFHMYIFRFGYICVAVRWVSTSVFILLSFRWWVFNAGALRGFLIWFQSLRTEFSRCVKGSALAKGCFLFLLL